MYGAPGVVEAASAPCELPLRRGRPDANWDRNPAAVAPMGAMLAAGGDLRRLLIWSAATAVEMVEAVASDAAVTAAVAVSSAAAAVTASAVTAFAAAEDATGASAIAVAAAAAASSVAAAATPALVVPAGAAL